MLMQSAVFVGPGHVELREVPIPAVGKDQLRVKIQYCALCGTDYHCIYSGLSTLFSDWSFGHELSGVIDAVSEEAEQSGFHVGDRVTANVLDACWKCAACKGGRSQYCETPNKRHVNGFAEYCVLSTAQVFKIPSDMDLMTACLTDPTACCIRGMDMAGMKIGQNVAISGVGGIGSILLNLILLAGGCSVTAIDPVPEKRALATKLGAQFTIDPFAEDVIARSFEITGGKGFDVVYEASGVPSAGELCVNMLAQCGTALYFAVYPPAYSMPLNLFNLYQREGRICTSYVTPACFPRSLQLLPRIQTDLIIGKTLPLSEIQTALALFKSAKYPKIVVVC